MFKLYLLFDDGNEATYNNVVDFTVLHRPWHEPLLTIKTEAFDMSFEMHDISEFKYTYVK